MNLAEKLLASAAGRPSATALRWRGEAWSYGELADRAARVAGGLIRGGVEPGDRIGLVCSNSPFFVLGYLGALIAGAIAVPLNPTGAPVEIEAGLVETGARLVVIGAAARDAVRTLRSSGRLDATAVVEADVGPGANDGATLEAMLSSEPAPPASREPDDVAVLAHTSGVSGSPKAAMLTHGSLGANLDQAARHPTVRIEADDVVLGALPLFHVYGLNAVLGLGLAAGAEIVLVERFDAHDTLELVGSRGVTVVPGVPPMFAAWLGLPGTPSDAFASVRVAISGAAPLPVAVQEEFSRRFGVPLHQGYGLTEASPVVTTTASPGAPRPGSIGVPLPGVEVRLVDRAGDDVLVGDPGEIVVRGPNVFAGYWNDDDATQRVLDADGWLHTGDVGVADDDGFLFIVDRSKDLVIVSGFNVYPAEVEEVLVRHGGVAGAAVVGIPHPHTGEAVKAYVVAEPGARLDEEELAGFCARFLARYKCPVAIDVVEELPRGLGGKLLRRELGNGPVVR